MWKDSVVYLKKSLQNCKINKNKDDREAAKGRSSPYNQAINDPRKMKKKEPKSCL